MKLCCLLCCDKVVLYIYQPHQENSLGKEGVTVASTLFGQQAVQRRHSDELIIKTAHKKSQQQ